MAREMGVDAARRRRRVGRVVALAAQGVCPAAPVAPPSHHARVDGELRHDLPGWAFAGDSAVTPTAQGRSRRSSRRKRNVNRLTSGVCVVRHCPGSRLRAPLVAAGAVCLKAGAAQPAWCCTVLRAGLLDGGVGSSPKCLRIFSITASSWMAALPFSPVPPHRAASVRARGDAGAAGGLRRAAADHHADLARRERSYCLHHHAPAGGSSSGP